MLFRQLFDQESSTYSYLIADLDAKEAILVDPVLRQVDRDLKLLKELGLTLCYCLETHIHADHITGTGKLREKTGCLGIVPINAQADCADRQIKDGEVIQLGIILIEAIATPGHTDSHMTYRVNGDRVLTGDALLIRGCGRTDLQGGDPGTLYDSVTQQLFTLPDEILVYPAHDYRGHTMSTIAEEKQWNPRFVVQDAPMAYGQATPTKSLRQRPDFIVLMENLDLPDPKKIMEAIPANQHCGNLTAID